MLSPALRLLFTGSGASSHGASRQRVVGRVCKYPALRSINNPPSLYEDSIWLELLAGLIICCTHIAALSALWGHPLRRHARPRIFCKPNRLLHSSQYTQHVVAVWKIVLPFLYRTCLQIPSTPYNPAWLTRAFWHDTSWPVEVIGMLCPFSNPDESAIPKQQTYTSNQAKRT